MTNQQNWDVIKERLLWGVSERNRETLETVEIGDTMVFYIRPVRIGGIFKAASEPFVSDEMVFPWRGPSEGETFPHRIRIRPVVVPREPLSFRPLIPMMSFITRKRAWGGYLEGRAMRPIPSQDYEKIRLMLQTL
jgi:predicted RNA-binding protein